MDPRPYQLDAVNDTMAAVAAGCSPALVEMATGLGKTFAALLTIQRLQGDKAAVVVAHRSELLDQWGADATRMGWRILREQADSYVDTDDIDETVLFDQPVLILASTMTWARAKRLKRFPAWKIGVVVLDEAHRSLSTTGRAIIAHFDRSIILGYTATAQKPGMLEVWGKSPVYSMGLVEGIDGGWLTPLTWAFRRIESWDFRNLTTPKKGEDFNKTEIAAMFEGEEGKKRIGPPQRIIRDTMHRDGGAGLVFAPSVASATAITNWLNTAMDDDDRSRQRDEWLDAGKPEGWIAQHIERVARPLRAACVTGDTSGIDRAGVMRRVRGGSLDVVVSVLVYCEGINIDELTHVFVLRCTALSWLYWQMVGRGPRLHPTIKHLVGQCATADERRALIAASVKPRCRVIQMVPMRSPVHLAGPATLLPAELQPPMQTSGFTPIEYEGTLDEIREQLEKEKEGRELAQLNEELRQEQLEEARREMRSRHLVDGSDIRGENVDLLGNGTRIDTSQLGMKWDMYREHGYIACGTATELIDQQTTLTKLLHDRALNADRARFEANHRSAVHDRDWNRWRTRLPTTPKRKSAGPWAKLTGTRSEMGEWYRKALIQGGMDTADAVKASGALFRLSIAWSQAGARKEADYWHHKAVPSWTSKATLIARRKKRPTQQRTTP